MGEEKEMSFKPTVLLYGLRPEMVVIHGVVKSIFDRHSMGCVITSGRDSHDGLVSLHSCGGDVPVCFALDYRSIHIADPFVKQRILTDLKTELPFCDIILHAVGGGAEHYHIEFDPKHDKVFQDKKAAWKRGENVNW